MIKFFINRVIAWFSGLTGKDFDKAIAYVREANDKHSVPDHFSDQAKDIARNKKRDYVLYALRQALPAVATYVLNMLLEMAVAYVKRGAR